jgi:hypothetical protein
MNLQVHVFSKNIATDHTLLHTSALISFNQLFTIAIMPVTKSSLETLASTFLSTFLSPSTHIALRTPNCTHLFAPSSLNIGPPKSNDAFAAHITNNILPLVNDFHITPKETNINESGRQITIWATAKPVFKVEAMGGQDQSEWDYTGEYLFILDVDEEGKITRVVEFVDSLATTRLRGLMVKAKENIGMGGKAW